MRSINYYAKEKKIRSKSTLKIKAAFSIQIFFFLPHIQNGKRQNNIFVIL